MIGISDSFKTFLSTCLDNALSEKECQLNLPTGTRFWFAKWGMVCNRSFLLQGEDYLNSKNKRKLEIKLEIEPLIATYDIYHTDRYLYLFNCISLSLSALILNEKENNKYTVGYTLFILKCIEQTTVTLVEKKQQDLSHIRMLEDASNNELYRKLFLGITVPVIILDNNLNVFDFNDLSRNLFADLRHNEKFFRSLLLGHETNKILQFQLMKLSHRERTDLKFDTYLETLKGKRFFRVMMKKVHLPRVKFNGVVVMFDDLSNRKKIEQHLENAKKKAEESDHLKTAFLANMSHEIRTPMNAIVGFSELLVSSNPTKEEMNEYLCLIKKSGTDLLSIIEDIIDIAKIEARQLKIKKKNCHPDHIFKHLEQVYKEQLTRSGATEIELKINVPENSDKVIFKTDTERLKQVLVNLLNNAIKFTDNGYIELGYEILHDNYLHFYMKDSGIGIPSEAQEKIFDRFFQVDDHLDRNNGGTGLGLAISKNIIKLLGGDLKLESVNGQGSCFSFDIPYEQVEEKVLNETDRLKSKKLNDPPDFTGLNVLIAEDEESNYFFLTEILRASKINISLAVNGLEAINIMEQRDDIDIVLMDIKMPEVNGLEAIRYIHKIKPEIPIIAQTANAMDNDRSVCMKAGCVDYITKPINKTLLFSMMKKHIIKKKKEIKIS